MKKYNIEINVSIKEGNVGDYSPARPIYFNIIELLPQNIDAERYLRNRIAEEIKRQFSQLADPIDNKTDAVKESEDPLAASF